MNKGLLHGVLFSVIFIYSFIGLITNASFEEREQINYSYYENIVKDNFDSIIKIFETNIDDILNINLSSLSWDVNGNINIRYLKDNKLEEIVLNIEGLNNIANNKEFKYCNGKYQPVCDITGKNQVNYCIAKLSNKEVLYRSKCNNNTNSFIYNNFKRKNLSKYTILIENSKIDNDVLLKRIEDQLDNIESIKNNNLKTKITNLLLLLKDIVLIK